MVLESVSERGIMILERVAGGIRVDSVIWSERWSQWCDKLPRNFKGITDPKGNATAHSVSGVCCSLRSFRLLAINNSNQMRESSRRLAAQWPHIHGIVTVIYLIGAVFMWWPPNKWTKTKLLHFSGKRFMGHACPNTVRLARHSYQVSKINVPNYFEIYTFLRHNSIFIISFCQDSGGKVPSAYFIQYKWSWTIIAPHGQICADLAVRATEMPLKFIADKKQVLDCMGALVAAFFCSNMWCYALLRPNSINCLSENYLSKFPLQHENAFIGWLHSIILMNWCQKHNFQRYLEDH